MNISINLMKSILQKDDIKFMFKSLHQLDEREQFVLYHRFGLNDETYLTLDEIATSLKLTRERVRQIQNNTLKKLKMEFRKIDPEYIARKEREHEIQEKIKKEKEKRRREVLYKKIEYEIRQEISDKMSQFVRPKRKPRANSIWERLAQSEHYKFISSFDYTAKCVKQLEKLIETGEIDERVRTVVAEMYPDLVPKTIRWYIVGKYLIVGYQLCRYGKYKRIDIYVPYLLASKENRERLLKEIRDLNYYGPFSSVEDLLTLLKLQR